MKIMPLNAAYIAGLVDGEGCISVSRTHTSESAKGCKRGFAYRSSLNITMTNLEILEWIKQITRAGKICSKRVNIAKHKAAWSWTVWSIEASELLQQLLPYLHIKKEQAENLIAFQSGMRQPGSKGLSDAEWLSRQDYYTRSKILNKRGISL